jgi:hypothetical protein
MECRFCDESNEPITDLEKISFGLITPDGSLYCVHWCGGHYDGVSRLVESGVLDSSNKRDYHGSVHISYGYFDYTYRGSQVTQAQLDTMVAFASAKNLKFNFDELEIIDVKKKRKAVRANPFASDAPSQGVYAR